MVGATAPDAFEARVHREVDAEYRPDAPPIVGFNRDGSCGRYTAFWEK